jgi:hypothetical protein
VGRVLSLDGRECLEDEISEPFAPVPPSPDSLSKNPPVSSSSLGRLLAERLLERGAGRLVRAARDAT